jgi:hypothetical protein
MLPRMHLSQQDDMKIRDSIPLSLLSCQSCHYFRKQYRSQNHCTMLYRSTCRCIRKSICRSKFWSLWPNVNSLCLFVCLFVCCFFLSRKTFLFKQITKSSLNSNRAIDCINTAFHFNSEYMSLPFSYLFVVSGPSWSMRD